MIKLKKNILPGKINFLIILFYFIFLNITSLTIALEAHVVVDLNDFNDMENTKRIIKKSLLDNYDISHSTLEFEHEMMC